MSAAQSKIRTSLTVDDPLVQDATYAFSPSDRAFIDEQIRALQQAVVDGSGLSGVFGAWLTLDSGSAAVAVGDCAVQYSATSLSVTRASGGALAGQQFAYVVLRAAAPGARVFVATNGVVPSNVTGLAKTAGVVRVNTSTGRCERVVALSAGDVQVGTASASGDLTIIGPKGADGADGTNYKPVLDASGGVAVGDSVSSASNASAQAKKAPAAVLASAPLPSGVSLTTAAASGTPTVATTGNIVPAASVPEIGVNATPTMVCVNPATGRTMRIALPIGTESYLGVGDTDGNLTVAPRVDIGTAPVHVIHANAQPYGAMPGGIAQQAPIASAIAAVPATGGTVYLHDGTYITNAPIVISKPGATLEGPGCELLDSTAGRCTIDARTVIGPAIVLHPPTVTNRHTGFSIPYAVPQAADNFGTANAAVIFDGTGDWFYNLRDLDCGNINGLAAFCLEFWMCPTQANGSITDGTFIASRARKSTNSTINTGLWVTASSQRFIAYLNIGGVLKSVGNAGGTLLGNTWTLFTLDYDGAHLRLYQDGVLAQSVAATGTVTQSMFEAFTFGVVAGIWPTASIDASSTPFKCGSFRLSNVTRYGAGTPTNGGASYAVPNAAFVADTNTMFVTSWQQSGILTLGTSAATTAGYRGNLLPAFLPLRTANSGQSVTDIKLKNLCINAGPCAIWDMGIIRTRLENLWCKGTQGVVEMDNNAYLSKLKNVQIDNGTQFCLRVSGASGLTEIETLHLRGDVSAAAALVLDDAAIAGRNIYIPPVSGYGLMARGLGGNVVSTVSLLSITDEGNTGFTAPMLLDGVAAFNVDGGVLECNQYATAESCVEVDGGTSATFTGVGLSLNAAVPYVVKLISNPVGAVNFVGCPFGTATKPWASAADIHYVNVIGAQGVRALQLGGVNVSSGTGSPNAAVSGSPGDVFMRTDGGAGTTFYVKETGSGTNTGWVGK